MSDSPEGIRLSVWSPGVPHPTHGASRILFWHYLVGLARAGFTMQNVLLLEPTNEAEGELDRYRDEMAAAGQVEVVPCRAAAFVTQGRLAPRLLEEPTRPAGDATTAFDPHVVLSFDLLSAWASRGLPGRRVVWLGDLNFETVWHHARYAAREDRRQVLRLPFAAIRARSWRRTYRAVLDGADETILAARSSEAALRPLGIAASYAPYPWPSEPEGPPRTWSAPDVPTFLFLGTLQALGSRSAFHFLLEELYPLLRSRWPRFRILVAGHGDPPRWATALMAKMPELELVGFIDDLDETFSQIHAVVAPIDVPIGNRSRIITAMGKGALVVAHRNAALGNPDLVDGRTCYLAADAESFADRLARAVEDRAEAAAIITRARSTYEARFAPSVAVAAMVSSLVAVVRR